MDGVGGRELAMSPEIGPYFEARRVASSTPWAQIRGSAPPSSLGRGGEERYLRHMKARPPNGSTKGRVATANPAEPEDGWTTADLPDYLHAELGARMLLAEQGKGLLPLEEAMADVDRMVEEILAVTPAPAR